MIFKILAIAEILLMFYSAIISLKQHFTNESREEKEIRNLYEQVDELVADREQSKRIEDIISSAEAYKRGEHEKALTLSYADADGRIKEFKTFVSDETLSYLYSERNKTRGKMKEKLSKIKSI